MLDAELAGLPPLAGLDLTRLDAFQLLHAIAADPAAFGLTDVTNACITPGTAPFFCQTPSIFLFWDGIHPTRAGHAILADEASSLLGF